MCVLIIIELHHDATCVDVQWFWQPFVAPAGPINATDQYQHSIVNHRRAYDIIIPYISPQIPRVLEQFVLWDRLLPCDMSRPLPLHHRPNLYLFNSRQILPGLRIK
jgi:hypothetical protein